MKHYRINKLTRVGGKVVKRKDILARDDEQAMARAENDEDCPVCEVLQSGKEIGSIT